MLRMSCLVLGTVQRICCCVTDSVLAAVAQPTTCNFLPPVLLVLVFAFFSWAQLGEYRESASTGLHPFVLHQ
jgi:hypothetical protein